MMPSPPAPVFGPDIQQRLMVQFRLAAIRVPAYRALLAEHGVQTDRVVDFRSFAEQCPVLSKRNTFDRFSLADLSLGGALCDVAEVLTSSGHGGRFSFGLSTRAEASASAGFVDDGLDAAFGVKSKATLAINCLPMGVVLSSHCMTVATTSVREDMAVALVRAFGDGYEQILLIGDPLFLKRLTDHAAAEGIDWGRHRVSVVVGEEIFGEHFRTYLAGCLRMEIDAPDRGYVMSSFGAGELGLNLCYETRATIALRRACHRSPMLANDLLGVRGARDVLPMIFSFDPGRTYIEVNDPDEDGYGQLTISMLDAARLVPLLRYQTGDIARLIDKSTAEGVLGRHSVPLPGELPAALLALQGRAKERLPDGSHTGAYKDALYADRSIATRLTGAFRLIFSGDAGTMHVQLARGEASAGSIAEGILKAIPGTVRPSAVVVWQYRDFPFGMSLDYERKFTYHVPGELRPDAPSATAPDVLLLRPEVPA